MKRASFAALAAISIASCAVAPFFGAAFIDFAEVFKNGTPAFTILWELRMPRTILAWLVGATLSVCGLIFQAIFRNPLASPDMLGVSSGAAFGVVLYVRLGFFSTFSGFLGGSACAAFVGALAAVAALYAAGAAKRGGFSAQSLLLSGIALNFLFASMNMIAHYTGGVSDSFRIMRWTMGALETVGSSAPIAALFGFLFIAAVGWAVGPQLDMFLCGEEFAQSRGVSVKSLRRFLFVAVSLVVGVSVALCGPIGFVGLMCPHICRRVTRVAEHRELAVACALCGGLFLTLCDAASRTLWSPAELPVGILTSSVGALFFMWLVVRRAD